MPSDTRKRLGYVLMTALSRRADGWSLTVGAAQDGADAVRRAVEEADRRQLVEALSLHVGTSCGEAVEEARGAAVQIKLLTAARDGLKARLAEANRAYSEIAGSLTADLAAIEAVLNGDPDACVEEGEIAARVLALRDERDALAARVRELEALHEAQRDGEVAT